MACPYKTMSLLNSVNVASTLDLTELLYLFERIFQMGSSWNCSVVLNSVVIESATPNSQMLEIKRPPYGAHVAFHHWKIWGIVTFNIGDLPWWWC